LSGGLGRRAKHNPHGFCDRDLEQTLNSQALPPVSGATTGASVNLANSRGSSERRLLLLNDENTANHVAAEVKIDNHWIVMDPSFRVAPRGREDGLLTRTDLAGRDIPKQRQRKYRGAPGEV